ncbi:chaplin family protein [Streptomyces sp. NPDC058773]|uniref:chaplin n=1 Tax=Streptomyces sp. NPDC058773 TaxID=3346632 RepID=UPI0036935F32
MRQVARKGLITAAAASGVLAMAAGYAHADAGAAGGAANSPGVGSGNNVQVPVHVPVNACGNTVNVVGLLNPAFGNRCANDGGGRHHGAHRPGGHTGAGAAGGASNSPGVVSGNSVQAPVDVPVNACGNNVSGGGLLNPAFGNHCSNGSSATPGRPHHPSRPHEPGRPHHPGKPHEPSRPHHPSTPHHPGNPHQPGNPSQQTPHKPGKPQTGGPSQQAKPSKPVGHLAQTGAGSIGYAVPASAGMLLGGALLYRKARAARR